MNQEFAVSKTYSLTMEHIGKVVDLAQRMNVSQGEIVRRAIDTLYEKMQCADQNPIQEQQS